MNLYQDGKKLIIDVPYSDDVLSRARALPDREFDPKAKVWWVPTSRFHARAVLKLFGDLGFEVDPAIPLLAQDNTAPVSMQHIDNLYPFQIEDSEFLERRGGIGFLGHDPGVGKTPITLDWIKNHNELEKIIVIGPTISLFNWDRLAMQWIGEHVYPVLKVDQPVPDERMIAMSYTMARLRDKELRKLDWDLLVVDECHRIKDSTALQSKALRWMSKKSAHRILISGKPFLNRVTELWHPFHVMDPIAWPDWWRFANRYTLGKESYWTGLINVEELKERISEFMVRRTKRDVLTWLPPITRQIIPITPMDDFMERYWAAEDSMVTDSANPLEVLTALRQIAGRETMLIVRDMAKNFMEESDEKLVIFFHHLEVMNFLMHELEKYGVDALYGDVSPQKKLEKAQRFQNEPLPRIMLINTAANESIDLFRSADIIFAEREWSPAPEEQAEARLDRNGQPRPVTSSYVTLTGTVVERLAGIVEGKRHEFGKVMRSDDIETSIMAELWDATRRAVATRKARAVA